MNSEMKKVLEKIKDYDRIVLFRHIRPDGDAIGSAKGLAEILKLTYPQKEVYLQSTDTSEQLAFLGGEDAPLPDSLLMDALGIVLDTATKDRISNPNYQLCRELIKIDHHIPVDAYGDIQWVEPHRSSACEMVVAFYDAFRAELKMNTDAATYLYMGMVTDSGRFRFSSTSGETLRLAGLLLDQNIDTDVLFAHLYLRDAQTYAYQAYVLKHMKISENGVASVYISKAAQEGFGISYEQAGDAVIYMDSIKGSLIWVAFIETDNEVRVRLRSRFVAINQLAERYDGGGHACACGATVSSRLQANRLLREADRLLKEYKTNNQGWL